MRHIELSEADKAALHKLHSQSGLRSKVFKRVTALLELDRGGSIEAVRRVVGLSYPPMSRLIERYQAEGLNCLQDKKQPGRPPAITGSQRAAITALACRDAPDGHACWTLRLPMPKQRKYASCRTISIRTTSVLFTSICRQMKPER